MDNSNNGNSNSFDAEFLSQLEESVNESFFMDPMAGIKGGLVFRLQWWLLLPVAERIELVRDVLERFRDESPAPPPMEMSNESWTAFVSFVTEEIAHKQPKRFYAIMYSIFAFVELKNRPPESNGPIESVILSFFHDVVRLVQPSYQAVYNSSITISMVQIAEELVYKTQTLNLIQAFKTRSFVQSQCYCGATGTMLCSICKMKQYCSQECQMLDSAAHQTICAPPPAPTTNTTTSSTSSNGGSEAEEGEEEEDEVIEEEAVEVGERHAKRRRTNDSFSTESVS